MPVVNILAKDKGDKDQDQEKHDQDDARRRLRPSMANTYCDFHHTLTERRFKEGNVCSVTHP